MVAVPVLGPVCVVGVTGAKNIAEILVLGRINVAVVSDHRDRSTGRAIFEDPRQDFRLVFLASWRGNLALPDAPPIELQLNVCFRQRDTGRRSLDDDAERRPMRLTPGGQAKNSSETAAHVCGGFPSSLRVIGERVQLSRVDQSGTSFRAAPGAEEPVVMFRSSL